MKPRGEDELIRRLRRRLQAAGEDLLGDDAAILPTSGPTAVTVDRQAAGTHFPADLDPAIAAHRLLAVNLSDLAAMGARPRYALLALAATDDGQAGRFLDAIAAACTRRGVVLAGGDLSRGAVLSATLTLIGEPYPGGSWVRRRLARAGDTLWVGGTLGESAAGRLLLARGATATGRRISIERVPELPRAMHAAARRAVGRHLRPPDQLELGCWLAGRERAAAIDLSDGMAADLPRLCSESGVGAVLRAADLPMSRRFGDLCRILRVDPLSLALAGGEDYVLAFTLRSGDEPPPEFACRAVGHIRAGSAIRLETPAGPRPLPRHGWDHFRA